MTVSHVSHSTTTSGRNGAKMYSVTHLALVLPLGFNFSFLLSSLLQSLCLTLVSLAPPELWPLSPGFLASRAFTSPCRASSALLPLRASCALLSSSRSSLFSSRLLRSRFLFAFFSLPHLLSPFSSSCFCSPSFFVFLFFRIQRGLKV